MEGQNNSARQIGTPYPLFHSRTSGRNSASEWQAERVQIQAGPVTLDGDYAVPKNSCGLVIFVHGSGRSRTSPLNRHAARMLYEAGLATLLFDLLTPEEEEMDTRNHRLRYDISLLARRAIGVVDWIAEHRLAHGLKVGLLGASTGAAAALIAAAERPEYTGAVVSRGGRPDLAAAALPRLQAPVLFLVAQRDSINIEINRLAMQQLSAKAPGSSAMKSEIRIVPGAGPLFEEPGAANFVLKMAAGWFREHLDDARQSTKRVNKG